jgi:protein SCO1/2
MQRQLRCIQIVIVTLLLSASCLLAQGVKKSPQSPGAGHAEAAYRGGLVNPPLPKPKFTLTDTSGAPYDLYSRTQGYVTLLFFGYTYCPDMCPAQMALIADALRKIPVESSDQVKVVFVTTDPGRDNPKVLRTWLDHFDNRFVGLTGSEAAIKSAQVAANIPPATKSTVRADGSYDVGHAAFVLAYTKDNLAHVIYPIGMKKEDWVHDLPLLVKESWAAH